MEWQKLTPEALEILRKEEYFLAYHKDNTYYIPVRPMKRDTNTAEFMIVNLPITFSSAEDLLTVFSHYCILEKPKEDKK